MTSVRRHFDVMCPLGIGRLPKNGGQRSDLISFLPNSFFYETVLSFCYLYELVNGNLDFFIYQMKKLSDQLHV